MDDFGLLQSQGRIYKSLHFNYDVRHPIILAKNDHLMYLIIVSSHRKVQHLGLQTTLSHVRNLGYWISKAFVDLWICY